MSVKVVLENSQVREFNSVIDAAIFAVSVMPSDAKTVFENGFSTSTDWKAESEVRPLSFAVMAMGKELPS